MLSSPFSNFDSVTANELYLRTVVHEQGRLPLSARYHMKALNSTHKLMFGDTTFTKNIV